MEQPVKVTYLKHSGFLVETSESYLLFDYWKGSLPPLDAKKTLYIFASHVHHDHYTKVIFKFENLCQTVHYILSWDIRRGSSFWKKTENVQFMKPYEQRNVDRCHITTLKSTDAGVAFLVKTEGLTIYHAGDLHWWDWPGEPEEDNRQMARRYQEELGRIAGERIDIAFVVLDPRQEGSGGYGLDYFLKHVGARYVFPMHCWEKYEMIKAYKNENDRKYLTSQIMEIQKPEEAFLLNCV